jgi:hypothetical protein
MEMETILKLVLRTVVDILIWGVFFTFLFSVIFGLFTKWLIELGELTQNERENEDQEKTI